MAERFDGEWKHWWVLSGIVPRGSGKLSYPLSVVVDAPDEGIACMIACENMRRIGFPEMNTDSLFALEIVSGTEEVFRV